MTSIDKTAFARIESEGRLFNAVLKAPTKVPGRFAFRGDIALKFAPKVGDEARPPELAVQQVIAAAHEDEPTFRFLAAYLHSFEYLKPLVEVLGDTLGPGGVYFAYCNNVDLLAKNKVKMNGATFYVLPCDETTVYNEILDILSIDKNDVKKLDTAGKTDYLIDKAVKFSANFEEISYEEGLRRMEPVKNRNANRPV